jgi:hypothetical protein
MKLEITPVLQLSARDFSFGNSAYGNLPNLKSRRLFNKRYLCEKSKTIFLSNEPVTSRSKFLEKIDFRNGYEYSKKITISR